MPQSDSDTESVASERSTRSSTAKRALPGPHKVGKRIKTKSARVQIPSAPFANLEITEKGVADSPMANSEEFDMEIGQPGPSGVARAGAAMSGQIGHAILTPNVTGPRYARIQELEGKAGSGFNTSPSYSRQLFENLITPNPMYRGFLLTHTSAHFPKVMYQTGAYLAGAVLAIGFAKLRSPGHATIDNIKLRVIGEVTAMNVSEELLLNRQNADALFLEIINFIFHSDPAVFRGTLDYTSDEYTSACTDADNLDIYPIAARFKVMLPWAPDLSVTQASIGDATRLCLWLATKLSTTYRQCKAELSFSYLIAMCRRGSVTSGFLNKVSDDIGTELGITVNFDEDLIRKIYRVYGLFINEFNAENVCRTLLGWIPEEGLRLRLIVQHAEGGGLTPHYTVKEALLKYIDFPWGRVNALLGGEIASFIKAWSIIRGNPFYGFKRDLKEASSQSFKSLAYVAKELLIQVGGKGGLRAYRGWTRTPASKALLDELIEHYMASLRGEDIALDADLQTKLSFIARSTR